MSPVKWLATMCCVAAALPLGCHGLAGRRQVSVNPGINDSYKNANVQKWIGRFERQDREIYRHRQEILATVGVSGGEVVADVGAGTGFMTAMFARQVGPKGKVFAVDITPEFIEHIRTLAAEQGLPNIETVLCREDSVELPPESVDLVFLCDTYHHLEYPRSTMRSIHAALKPGGDLIVIDFDRIEGVSRDWIIGHVRAAREAVKAEIVDAGFELIEDVPVPFFKENYFLRFRKAG